MEPDASIGGGVPLGTAGAWHDLATRRPGHGLRVEMHELLTGAGITDAAGLKPAPAAEIRPYAAAYLGQEKVALELALLEDGWLVLHSVPLGHRVPEVDHLVIGPTGVFVVRSTQHLGRQMDLRGDCLYAGVQLGCQVSQAREQARVVRDRLHRAGCDVPVAPIVCVVGTRLRVHEAPAEVQVLTTDGLISALRQRPVVLSRDGVSAVHEVARRSTTWVLTTGDEVPDWVGTIALEVAAPMTQRTCASEATPAAVPIAEPAPRRRRLRLPASKLGPRGWTVRVLAVLALAGVASQLPPDLAGGLAASPAGLVTSSRVAAQEVPAQYRGTATMPEATVGGPCAPVGEQARTRGGYDLLTCAVINDLGTATWVYADPWRQLPPATPGSMCSPVDSHARALGSHRVALVCAPTPVGERWTPDPRWQPGL